MDMSRLAMASQVKPEMAGAFGGSQKSFIENLESVKGNHEIDRLLRYSTMGLGMGIMGFAAAAGPDIAGTFTGSVKLLAGEIGNAFIPEIVKASGWLQNMADKFHGLDEATKDSIGSWGMFSLKTLAVSWAFVAVVRNGLTLLPVMRGLRDAASWAMVGSPMNLTKLATASAPGTAPGVVGGMVGAISGFALAHPFITAGVAVAAVGVSLWALNQSAQRAAVTFDQLKSVESNIDRLAGGGRVTRADYLSISPEQRRLIEMANTAHEMTGPFPPGQARPMIPASTEQQRRQLDHMIEETRGQIARAQTTGDPEDIARRLEEGFRRAQQAQTTEGRESLISQAFLREVSGLTDPQRRALQFTGPSTSPMTEERAATSRPKGCVVTLPPSRLPMKAVF